MNEHGNEIASYKPPNATQVSKGAVRNLKGNEELLGVYGKVNDDGAFTTFGFIVKVNSQ